VNRWYVPLGKVMNRSQYVALVVDPVSGNEVCPMFLTQMIMRFGEDDFVSPIIAMLEAKIS